MKIWLFLISVLISVNFLFSKNNELNSSNSTPPDTTITPTDTSGGFSYFYTEEEESKYLNFKPILGLGIGTITYYGDVKDVYHSSPIVGLKTYNFSVAKGLRSFLDVEFRILKGSLTGNERSLNRNLNFKTDFLSGGVSLSYNFEHILKKKDLLLDYKKQRKLIPYLSLGIETFSFNSKADLLDSEGNKYFYWKDGSIRNILEGSASEEQSVILTRDYKYETDLREMNNDGLGKYDLQAFAIPIDASIELQIHERVKLRLGTTYHYNLSDLVDDVSNSGVGIRNGKYSGDSYLYTYFAFKLDIFSSEKEIEEPILQFETTDKNIDDIVLSDEDNDGIDDLKDKCIETPKGITVDSLGCPFDDDKDGFANFKDDELQTPKDSITNLKGVELSEEEITALSDSSDAIFYHQICAYYPSMCGIEMHRLTIEEVPAKFIFLDEDADGYISIDEASKAIDTFFDMKSDLTIDDIYELTEFFFGQ